MLEYGTLACGGVPKTTLSIIVGDNEKALRIVMVRKR